MDPEIVVSHPGWVLLKVLDPDPTLQAIDGHGTVLIGQPGQENWDRTAGVSGQGREDRLAGLTTYTVAQNE